MQPIDYQSNLPPSKPPVAPPPLPVQTAVPPSLSPENLRELATARAAVKKINRASRMAVAEGFSIAIFGGLSIVIQYNSIPDVIAGAVLLGIGIVEIITARGMRRLDARSARNLALNQLFFAVVILAYASWNLYGVATQHNGALPGAPELKQLSPDEQDLLGGEAMDLAVKVETVLYGGMIAAGLVEVGMAAYYRSKIKTIRQYIQFTPPWVIGMQKAGIAI